MKSYASIRQSLIQDVQQIINLEQFYTERILKGLSENALKIRQDFDKTIALRDFWFRYAPRQRGHKPSGKSLPWGEVGEKVLDAYLYKIIVEVFDNIHFVGLPYGHDIRFVSEKAFVQMDIKSTGPTDNADEVVASPNQVSGDGLFVDENGVFNSKVLVTGSSKTMEFQPELPPFYVIDNEVFITLTFYLKCVYKVIDLGNQPLDYLELICVPNGLVMFDTLHYAENTKGLLTPGKDILTSEHKRTRIKLNPLSEIAKWRCQKIVFSEKSFEIRFR